MPDTLCTVNYFLLNTQETVSVGKIPQKSWYHNPDKIESADEGF